MTNRNKGKKMGKVIEFYGPPGSGKTKLAKIAIKYLKKKEIRAINPRQEKLAILKEYISKNDRIIYPSEGRFLEFLFKILPETIKQRMIDKSLIFCDRYQYKNHFLNRFIIENALLLKNVVKSLDYLSNYYKDDKRAEKVLNMFKKDWLNYQLKEEGFKNSVIVLDECFLMRISTAHSLHGFKNRKSPPNYKKNIVRLTKNFSPRIDYAFYITADPEICNSRQKNRGRIIGEKSDEEKRLKGLEKRIEHFELIHKTLDEKGVFTFKINTEGSLEESIQELKRCFDEIISDL